MNQPATVMLVRLKTPLSHDEAMKIASERAPEFRNSELRNSIAKAYKTEGEPRVEVYKVLMPLREVGT